MAILKATFNVKKDIGYDELSVASRGVDVAYGNGTSGLVAVDVQDAIDEVVVDIATKQNAITGGATTITSSNLTANKALISDGSGKVATSTVSSTELGYLSGVTSGIQAQIGTKQNTITGGATTVTSSNLTANRALVSDGSGKISASTITSTILGFLANVTSDIQTQINTFSTRLPVGSRVLVQEESQDGRPSYGTWNAVNYTTYFIPEGGSYDDRYIFYQRIS